MTAKSGSVGNARLNATTGGAYETTPLQRYAATVLVHRYATGPDDEQHLLTVLGITLQDGAT
ncbi:hypothetical protein [Streptomyces scopuliridis]|uniref:Uncharacterized protein n=1 Tax=Streptomyces scopuliridis TaxID=452529 RepID=A0ACD4ZPZ8_9ACTN|nr:hypothetical protein [Streptomyces scopuliridis]WSC00107.1 hypothetical protein OG835_25985 [Streptomyces scopuliridis]